MQFFTLEQFQDAYPDYASYTIPAWQIIAASEMIFSQIGLRYRDTSWDTTSVPLPIQNAAMEQLRFMLDHDIPFVDINKRIKAGSMDADLNSDYSTLALRILANNGYMYRGSRMSDNMAIDLPFGD